MNKALCVIVPDVHGRTFWKDIDNFDCDVIFLGDYVDPYGHENISKKEALENFKEIIEYAKSHSNVTLLLGNHDCEYSIGTRICNCRCDSSRYDTIRNLFLENSDLFSFAVIREYANKKYLFSHAGIHPLWLKSYKDLLSIDYLCNVKCVEEDKNDDPIKYKQFCSSLIDVSGYRGGWDPAGSIIWSDIREYKNINKYLDVLPYIQICGHTMLTSKAINIGSITCVDLKKIVLIDENGNLCNKDFTLLETETVEV